MNLLEPETGKTICRGCRRRVLKKDTQIHEDADGNWHRFCNECYPRFKFYLSDTCCSPLPGEDDGVF